MRSLFWWWFRKSLAEKVRKQLASCREGQAVFFTYGELKALRAESVVLANTLDEHRTVLQGYVIDWHRGQAWRSRHGNA